MKQLIIGTVISLIGLGLIISTFKILGVLVLIIGVATGIRGRTKIDNS
jgi:hypothetical protein